MVNLISVSSLLSWPFDIFKNLYSPLHFLTNENIELNFLMNSYKILSYYPFSRSVMSDSLRPMDCSTSGLPVHRQLPELAQTHVHRVSDVIQPSHPLSSPSPPAFSLSQHQGLFQWVSSSHQVAKLLEFQLQHQSFQWIFMTDFL